MSAPLQDESNRWSLPTFLLLSFLCMIVWPLLGIALMHPMFDQWSEGMLFFGSLSLLFLLPIYAFITPSELVIGVILLAIWLLAWVCSSVWVTRGSSTKTWQIVCLAALSFASFVQAALGSLMILGKAV